MSICITILFALSVVYIVFLNDVTNWAKDLENAATNAALKSLAGAITPLLKTISVIVFVTFIITILTWIKRIQNPKNQRRKTRMVLIHSLVKYALIIIGFILILKNWNVDVSSIAITTGGFVVCFGICLKSIVQDFAIGMIIVFENNIQIGDIVTFGNFKGTIREIGTRVTLIENVNNNILIINNSCLANVVNHSIHTSRVLLQLLIPKRVTQEEFLKVFNANKKELEKACPDIIGEISYYGITGYDRFNTTYVIYFNVKESRSLQTQKTIYTSLNKTFEEAGWLN